MDPPISSKSSDLEAMETESPQTQEKTTGRVNKSKASCCVPHCSMTGYVLDNGKVVTFHRFPKDEARLKQWLFKIRRDTGPNFHLSKYTQICSRHFDDSDFQVRPSGKRYLKNDRVPSKFPWNKPILKRKRTDRDQHMQAEACMSEDSSLDESTFETTDQENERLKKQVESLQKSLDITKRSLSDQQEEAAMYKKERDHLKRLYSRCLAESGTPKNFSLEIFKDSPEDIAFYTGFPNFELLMQCFVLLNPGENGENMVYCYSADAERKQNIRKTKKLSAKDEFFLVLVRLRQGFFVQHLAYLFQISKSSVQRTLTSWINFMYLRLGNINIWPSQQIISETMPPSMKEKYPNLTWIIDAFEIQTERPSTLKLASMSYSNYKSRNTCKGLIACTPSGQIGFISQLYTGSISDRELTIRSNFLTLPHTKGSMWLVDKGFQIQDLVDHMDIKVNMPAFVGKKSQMSADEVFHTQQVASERIHVERAINKVKSFHIFDKPIPICTIGSINQIWTVCALLTLFQNPIISA